MKEKIIESAVKFGNNIYTGKRHNNCFKKAHEAGERSYASVQGFITSHGRFVNRRLAGVIAYESGQLNFLTEELYSEDLF